MARAQAGFINLGTLNGGTGAGAQGISADGSVVVGRCLRWDGSQCGTRVSLDAGDRNGELGRHPSSATQPVQSYRIKPTQAVGVSADGLVVAGNDAFDIS